MKQQQQLTFLRLPKSLSTYITFAIEYFFFFLASSTIHGLNHIADRSRHISETLIWVTLVCLAFYGAGILSGLTLTRYQDNPTVISMERDRFSWNTSFPSATICPTVKLEQSLLDEYLEKSPETNKVLLQQFLKALANASYDNFEAIPKYDKIKPDDYMKLLLDLQYKFKPSVTNSGVNNIGYYVEPIITEMGICYTFNSQMQIYFSPNYLAENKWEVYPENNTFYVNPLDGEVFANVVNMTTGFNIYLHGPFEVADVASKAMGSPNGFFLQLYLTALSIYSSDRTRGLKVNQRKCRFYEESDLAHSPVYSFVLCRIECRINLALKLCGCIPHFYRRLDSDTICNVDGLHCLAKHKDRLITLRKECQCHQNCDEVNYILSHQDSREWFLGSNLQWGLKEYPRMRLKRDVIFGFADVLVYIGGMTGLFVGSSVLSFIEIVYYFTLRLFWFNAKHGVRVNDIK